MTPQELQFELMKQASFNSFTGEQVVKDLLDHKDLWKGAVMDSRDLIKLRDIDRYWSVDTLYITPKPGKEIELEELAKTWQADEVDYLGAEESCKKLGFWSSDSRNNEKQILRVWWD
jgi:hypothetical protein